MVKIFKHKYIHKYTIKPIKQANQFLPWGVAFLCAADPLFSSPLLISHFSFISVYLHNSSPPPPHAHTLLSPSPHAPPLWSCHLSAPAQSLLRPTAHLPPAPLTAPVANANVHTHTSTQTHTHSASSNPTCPDVPVVTRSTALTHIQSRICLSAHSF